MQGRVTVWKEDRGFGFIDPNSGGDRVFFHISDMSRGAGRPSVGVDVIYQLRKGSNGKLRAVEVAQTGTPVRSRVPTKTVEQPRGVSLSRVVLSILSILVFPLLLWLVNKQWLPLDFLWAFLGSSIVALTLYGIDKSASKRSARRIPESWLHMSAFFFGWPGALLAQQLFRHKSSKLSFQFMFWFTVVLNLVALVLLSSSR